MSSADMGISKVKQSESGEEFVFDEIKKVPIVGALYAVPRTVTYGLMGNSVQSMNSAKAFVSNLKDTVGAGAALLIAPVALTANAGGQIVNKVKSMGSSTPPTDHSAIEPSI